MTLRAEVLLVADGLWTHFICFKILLESASLLFPDVHPTLPHPHARVHGIAHPHLAFRAPLPRV